MYKQIYSTIEGVRVLLVPSAIVSVVEGSHEYPQTGAKNADVLTVCGVVYHINMAFYVFIKDFRWEWTS